MIKNFDEYDNNSINEKRLFTIEEIKKKAREVLKGLGVKIPTEEEVKDMVNKLKSFIKDHETGVIQENNDNLDKSYKAGSKFGITVDPDKVFRPNNFLVFTRYEIAEMILQDVYGEEYDDEIGKYINDFAQKLSDKDCEDFVKGRVEAYQQYVNEDALINYFIEESKDIVKEKNFKLK